MSRAMADFLCPVCGVFEALVDWPVSDKHPCPTCPQLADWIISAPMLHVKSAQRAWQGTEDVHAVVAAGGPA